MVFRTVILFALPLLLFGCGEVESYTPTLEDIESRMEGILFPPKGEKPQQEVPKAEPEPVVKYILRMHSASYCGPCKVWQRQELPQVKYDVEIIEWDKNPGRPAWVTVYPTFELVKRIDNKDTQLKIWRAYTSAEDINGYVVR